MNGTMNIKFWFVLECSSQPLNKSPDCNKIEYKIYYVFINISPPHVLAVFSWCILQWTVWQNTRNFKATGNKCIKTLTSNTCLQYQYANGMNLHKCFQRTENLLHDFTIHCTCDNYCGHGTIRLNVLATQEKDIFVS